MSRAIAKLRHAGRAAWLQILSLGLAIALGFVGVAALAWLTSRTFFQSSVARAPGVSGRRRPMSAT